MTSRSSVAPGTRLIRPSNSASLPTLLSRHTATTSYPRSSACWTMYFPSFPDAPTTQILMTRLDSSQFRAIEPAAQHRRGIPAANQLAQSSVRRLRRLFAGSRVNLVWLERHQVHTDARWL